MKLAHGSVLKQTELNDASWPIIVVRLTVYISTNFVFFLFQLFKQSSTDVCKKLIIIGFKI